MVGTQRHQHARTDAVAETDRHGRQQQGPRAARQWQRQQSCAHDDQRGHHYPTSAHLVHHLAGRVKKQHVDTARHAVDERSDRWLERQLIGPERDHGLPRGAHGADQQYADAQCDEDMAVVTQRGQYGRRRGPGFDQIRVSPAGIHDKIGHTCSHGARHQQRRNADTVGSSQSINVNGRGRGERANEHADAHGTAQRGHGPCPVFDRYHLRQVTLPRKRENGLRHAHHEAADREHAQVARPPAQRHGHRAPERACDDGPTLSTVHRDQRSRDVAHQRTYADQRHQKRRHRNRGPHRARGQRDDRQDRPLAEPEQKGRPECVEGDAPQRKVSGSHRSTGKP